MNKIFYLIAIAMLFFAVSCSNDSQKVFHALEPIVVKIDNMQLQNVEDIIKDGKFGSAIKGEPVPATMRDSRLLFEQAMGHTTLPLSHGVGKTFGGHVVFTHDSLGAIAAVFLVSSDSVVYVWPDGLAGIRETSAKEQKTFVTMVAKMGPHAEGVRKQFVVRNPSVPSLELLHPKSVYMLAESDCPASKLRFDLSSLCFYNADLLCVSDKLETPDIYKVDTLPNQTFEISVYCKGPNYMTQDIDFEAIDVYKGRVMVADEQNNLFYLQKNGSNFQTFQIDIASTGEDMVKWGVSNTGIEGFAVDNENDIIYIAKEREPRQLFCYNVKTNSFSFPFDDVVKPDDGDISDLKYENGYVYMLDRANCYIKRIDVKTKECVTYTFRNYSNNGRQHVYKADFGMCEGLAMTKDAIFIAMDNNGDPVSDFGESIGLQKGSVKPCIIVLKRPEDF